MSLIVQRYLILGVFNTILGYGIISAAMFFGGIGPAWANASGYAVGLVVAFFAYKYWVFVGTTPHSKSHSKSHGKSHGVPHGTWWRQVRLFILSFVFSYMGNMVMLMVCLYVLYVNPYMAQIMAMMTYTILFYLINRHVVWAIKYHGDMS